MYDIQSIYRAVSVEDANSALQKDPSAVVIAGGSDVLIKIREGKLADSRLVSIHGLREELEGVTLLENGDIAVGPLTTFRGVTGSEIIQERVSVLGEATSSGQWGPSAATSVTASPLPTRPPPLWPWTSGCTCGARRAGGSCPFPSGIRGWAKWTSAPPSSCAGL